jgi:hypothetical protein
MCTRPFIASCVAATTMLCGAALAAAVKPPCELPPGAANVNPRLPEIHKGLVADQARLNPSIEWFNGNCTKGKIEKGSALDQKCGTVKNQSMPQWATYEKARKQYERERAKAIRAAEVAVIDWRLATTKAALHRNAMRGGKLDQDIEAWVALQDEARKRAQEAILDMAKEIAFEKYKETVVKRFPEGIKEAKKNIENWPQFDFPELMKIRDDVLARLSTAKTADEFGKALEWMKNTVDAAVAGRAAAQSPRDREKWALFVVEIGKAALPPALGLVVEDAKLMSATLYGWAVALSAKERYKEISALGEAQYTDAKRLAALYEKDLRAKNDLAKKPVAVENRCL